MAMSSGSPGRAVRRVLAVLMIPVLLLVVRPLAARADGGLQVVAVRPTQQGVTAVVGVDPAPLVPLPGDAAAVTTVPATSVPATSGSSPAPSGKSIPVTVSPVVDLTRGTPLALVVDASAAGAEARAQTLSGSAGLLLRLPSQTPVTVVADASPPRLLTRDGARPSDAITALTNLSTSGGTPGSTSTAAALELAVQHLPQSLGGGRVVVLTTSAPPPTGDDAQRLVDSLARAGVVLGVVGTGSAGTSWKDVAAATGGTAVAAVPTDASAAYDSLLATLQGRYMVRFVPPAGAGQVMLAVTSAGQRFQTVLTIPGATPAPSAAPATTRGSTSSGLPGWILPGVAVLAGLVLVTLLLLRRRSTARRHTARQGGADVDEAAPPVEAPVYDVASLPGVRLFDVSDPEQPTEIADPRAASAAPQEPQEAEPQEPVPQEAEPQEPVPQEAEPQEVLEAEPHEPVAPQEAEEAVAQEVQEAEPQEAVAQEVPEAEPHEAVAPQEPVSERPPLTLTPKPAPEPSTPPTPAFASTEYVGRHRAPSAAVDDDDDDDDDEDHDAGTEAGQSESAPSGPGAHRERRRGAGSFRGVG